MPCSLLYSKWVVSFNHSVETLLYACDWGLVQYSKTLRSESARRVGLKLGTRFSSHGVCKNMFSCHFGLISCGGGLGRPDRFNVVVPVSRLCVSVFFQTVFCSSRRESKISRLSSGSSSMKPESSWTGDCLASSSLAHTIISRMFLAFW